MIADFINPHGKPTKQFNSIEFLLEQVIKGTYEYGEDKILQTTLPKAMIDHAFKLYQEEMKKSYNEGTGMVLKAIKRKFKSIANE